MLIGQHWKTRGWTMFVESELKMEVAFHISEERSLSQWMMRGQLSVHLKKIIINPSSTQPLGYTLPPHHPLQLFCLQLLPFLAQAQNLRWACTSITCRDEAEWPAGEGRLIGSYRGHWGSPHTRCRQSHHVGWGGNREKAESGGHPESLGEIVLQLQWLSWGD